MSKRTISNIKLGVFVLAGLLFLILLLFMIGRNQNLFGSSFELKARFHNLQGLRAGNNVRFAGIQAGTVKRINILNDTTIEVVMLISMKMKKYIRKSAVASIGTDGLMGNKLINIFPSRDQDGWIETGDLIHTRKTTDTDDMLQILSGTNNDAAVIAAEMKAIIQRINNSTAVWKILNDNTLPGYLRSSLANVRSATAKAMEMADNLNTVIKDVQSGKGSLGAILTDSSFAENLNEAIGKIKSAGEHADSLASRLTKAASNIEQEITGGRGAVTALLSDTAIAGDISQSLENIRKGTDDFNQLMTALKKNFLFRGYFRRLEKQKQKETGDSATHQ